MAKAVIVDALRTPLGRFGGGLLEFSAGDLATHVLRALVERNSVRPAEVDEVLLGQVLQGGDGNLARKAAAAAGLPVTVCGTTVNMACASGMKALDLARQAILLGEGRLYLAGGAESMSNAPYYLQELRWGNRLGNVALRDAVMEEGLCCPLTGQGMGAIAEKIAVRTGITREEMDACALRSHQRALTAQAEGRFADEILPVPRRKAEPLAVDEQPRETSVEALAQLRPAFAPEGCVTAGNSSGINDGAAAVLLAEEGYAREQGWRPRATLLASATAGAEPEALDLAPAAAVRKLCAHLGVAPGDFELVEFNEAFAVQALSALRDLGLDEARVNVNGGGISLGHPLGATGARLVVTLLHEMEKRELRLGLAALCIGGGMGMAMALQREA